MFDFQKLSVYLQSKELNKKIFELISKNDFDKHVNDQLKRATFSIMLNIAEGSGRFSNRDRRNFLVIARSSAFECVAILDFLVDINLISETQYSDLELKYEEISKMLFSLIRKLEN